MFRRFFRYMRALIMGKLDQWEDPEVIINESLREMKENQVNKALYGLQFDETSQSFDRAEERIKNMQSEASARAEVAKTSVNSRLEQLDDQQVDVEADQALQALEAKLGLAGSTVNSTQP